MDASLHRIRSVTAEDVQALARELAAAPRTTVVVAPFDSEADLAVQGA